MGCWEEVAVLELGLGSGKGAPWQGDLGSHRLPATAPTDSGLVQAWPRRLWGVL